MLLMVLSGLVLWKPVQFHELSLLMGQYEGARYVHFFGMVGIVLFLVVHIVLTLLVPKVLLPMITGRAPPPAATPKMPELRHERRQHRAPPARRRPWPRATSSTSSGGCSCAMA